MRIVSTEEVLRNTRPHSVPGVFVCEWNGHLLTMVDEGSPPLTEGGINDVLTRLDARFPTLRTSWTANLDVLLLPYTLCYLGQDGVGQRNAGEAFGTEQLALSAGGGAESLHDLVGHELAHVWAEWLGAPTKASTSPIWDEIAVILGDDILDRPVSGVPWQERRQEVLAEVASFVLYGCPLFRQEAFPGQVVAEIKEPTIAQARVFRQWALAKTPRVRTVEMTVGRRDYFVDGVTKYMEVAPYIAPKTGRTVVPIRMVAEGLGAKVDWEQELGQVTITMEVRD